jgi:hypothetical protein
MISPRKFLFGAALLFALTDPAFSAVGTVTAEFLTDNPSARQVGMGGITAVTASPSEALHSNPSGIGSGSRPEANFSYSSGRDESGQAFVGYAAPLSLRSSVKLGLGAGLLYYSAGNVDINVTGGPTRAFNAEKDYAGILGLSASVPGRASIGITPKFIRSTLVEQYTASAYAADLGFQVYPLAGLLKGRLEIGGALRNLGSKISYKSASHDLPRTTALGAAIKLLDRKDYGTVTAGLQIEKLLDDAWQSKLGGEYQTGGAEAPRVFFLRAGYRPQSSGEGFSVGFGAREKNLQIDYAFVNGTELENTHRVTLVFRFGRYIEPPEQDELIEEMRSEHEAMPQREKEKILRLDQGQPEEFRIPDIRKEKTQPEGNYRIVDPKQKGYEVPELIGPDGEDLR